MSGKERKEAPATIDHVDLTVGKSETRLDMGTQEVAYSTNGGTVFSQPVPIVAQAPDPNRKPKDYVMTNCFVVFACNFIFGFIGYHFGVKSNWAWKLGQEEEARKKGKIALIFAIVGICVGLLTYSLAFGLYFGLDRRPVRVLPDTG